jgi:glycosyltransferase involved in cell wall biosynthesis
MRIAFIHYHLKTGGVTTVLKHQVEALSGAAETLVLTGEPPLDSKFPADVIHVSGLAYNAFLNETDGPEKIAGSVIRAIHKKWPDGCDLLHVHNPTLAKNRHLLAVLKILQNKGLKLFLQIHDFAEDGRPSLFYADEYVPDCHYGVINSRDHALLMAAGLNPRGLHSVPNPIIPTDIETIEKESSPYVLYPVRALRRKNIGEAVLLSRYFKSGEILAVTLPPNSPSDMRVYDDWKTFVAGNNLPVIFEAGLTEDFESLVASSRSMITTSITEGFGLAFLEPWTFGKLLWGRRLSPICRDFEKNGVKLGHLYDRLAVPTAWIDKPVFHAKWKSSLLKICERFEFYIDEAVADDAFNMIIADGSIDFGSLDEASQRQVISRIGENPGDADELLRWNPFLGSSGQTANAKPLIDHNRMAILKNYGLKAYRENFLTIYSRVIKEPVFHRIDKKVLLAHFLNPETFGLLKWGEYVA